MKKTIYAALLVILVGGIIGNSIQLHRATSKFEGDYQWLKAGRITDLSNTINLANYQETNQTQLREWVIRLAELTAKVEAQCRAKHTLAVDSNPIAPAWSMPTWGTPVTNKMSLRDVGITNSALAEVLSKYGFDP